MNFKNTTLHVIFCINIACILNISSCKQVEDPKTKVPTVTLDTSETLIKVQEAPLMDKGPVIESITFDFTSKKGVYLDSIQLYRCDSNDDYESLFHFYYKEKRYTQEIYFSGIKDNFSFVHMNKDKYLDIVYENFSVSGQGCLAQDIFIFNPVLKKYLRNEYLSAECYLSYNKKLDVYSGYSRGSGQAGPWNFAVYKLKRDTLHCFESLFEEKIVTCLDSLCNNAEIRWKYTHYCHGDTTFYENFGKSEVVKYIWMSEKYDPSKKCQFIK